MEREASARIRVYRELLLTWSAKINLIGPEARRHIDEHIEEGIAAARVLRPDGEVLDVGSGGGLPAIPMAIVSPEARFHLVEADRRKWAFLKQVIRECSLNSVAHGDRLANVIGRLDPDLLFQLVTSRAVGHPEQWIPLVLPHLAGLGKVALFQTGRDVPDVAGLEIDRTEVLPRGESNFLQILRRST
ncbi:MAG: RsmG family class I SAM-dependent methyltransferase [Thermoanaerobaculia bacterium]